jgi:hypothetical protein
MLAAVEFIDESGGTRDARLRNLGKGKRFHPPETTAIPRPRWAGVNQGSPKNEWMRFWPAGNIRVTATTRLLDLRGIPSQGRFGGENSYAGKIPLAEIS